MTPRDLAARDGKLDVWIMNAAGDLDVGSELMAAVSRASELRHGHPVTSEQVRAQLPSPSRFWPQPDMEWDVRSIAQRLRKLADDGRLIRSGMRPDGPGSPVVQHWARV